jgi:hypothetical protein
MVSQILFGERFRIVESAGSWYRAVTIFDSYSGWIDSLHGGYEDWVEGSAGIITSRQLTCTKEDGSFLTLYPGSELFGLRDDFSGFTHNSRRYLLKDHDVSSFTPYASVSETALQFLNAPYLRGGRTTTGIDCSGLVQTAFKLHGTALPRNAAQQAEMGITINFFTEAKPGDVLFFSGEDENISHTGILYKEGIIIHASGSVRLDRADHQGIWNDGAARYTHKLRLIKRIQ